MIKIKICGLSEEKTLLSAIAAGANFVGFVHFSKSPRHVSLARAAELKSLLPNKIKSVLVVVDPDDALLKKIAKLSPDYVQLHGHETPERVAEIRKKYPKQKLIKALPVENIKDAELYKNYSDFVDMILFDAKPQSSANLPGGNGISFDWKIMQKIKTQEIKTQKIKTQKIKTPKKTPKKISEKIKWILSGGLKKENVTKAIKESKAKIIDVSSGVESSKGIKNSKKITSFIKHVKRQ